MSAPSSQVGVPATTVARKPAGGRVKRQVPCGTSYTPFLALELDLVEGEDREVADLAGRDHPAVVQPEEPRRATGERVHRLLDRSAVPRSRT